MSRSSSIVAACIVMLSATAAPARSPNAESRPWSFAPLKKPALPQVKNDGWACDELDRFILARLDAANVQPNADADRATLLRRLTFDLIGLPPTEQQITAFLNDSADDDQATILHLLGLDHESLTFHYAGRDFRLTDTAGKVHREILS